MLIYLIGLKCDLEEDRKISLQEAKAFAKDHDIQRVFEASALTGFNVEDIFVNAGKELYLEAKSKNAKAS